jgi:hypothetical protein
MNPALPPSCSQQVSTEEHMSRTWLVALMLIAAPAFADRGPDRGRDGLPDNAVTLDGQQLRSRLEQLSDLLDRAAHEKSARSRERVIADARRELQEVRRMVHGARTAGEGHHPQTGVVQPPAPGPAAAHASPPPGRTHGARAMDERAYAQLRQAMERETFGRERLGILETAARTRWFTVAQVKALVESFDFPRERLQAVGVVEPRIVDTENTYQLYDMFTFSSDKAELRKLLES